MTRIFLSTIFLTGILSLLISCGKDETTTVDLKLLSTDIHVSVAQKSFVLPFIALDDYAFKKQSFSLNRKEDHELASIKLNKFIYETADPTKPLVIDNLSISVNTYGWNDGYHEMKKICTLLTREWSRSTCDNPWAAIQQALPANRFELVDLRHLQIEDLQTPVNCSHNNKHQQFLLHAIENVIMICPTMVSDDEDATYFKAVIRVDEYLGAKWTVWRNGQNGETVEAMVEREGKAIIAFVQYGLKKREDFRELHSVMCKLRRPGSTDSPGGTDCGNPVDTVSHVKRILH